MMKLFTSRGDLSQECHPERTPVNSSDLRLPKPAANLHKSAFVTTLGTILLALALVTVTNSGHAETKPTDDPILHAMQAELDREKAVLVLPGMQRPYFIEYRLDDIATYEAVANYGALTREEQGHQRLVRVMVRIGDYASDSSTARADGAVQMAPRDNDPVALQYALWTATDEAYKLALRTLAAKQAALKQFQSAPMQQDFAPAHPETFLGPVATLDLDRTEWKRRLVEASGLFLSDPEVRSFASDVQYSTTDLRAVAVNRYLVNTEGTSVRQGYSGYNAAVSVGGQAPDGMRLARDNGTVATTASELETWPQFHKRVLDDLKSLEALRKAPLVSADDYHGPVLFSGDAAADVFNKLFLPNVEAERPEMGTTARTQGAYNSSLHSAVLPENFSVKDDPLLTTFEGRHLLGAYPVDDEGVPASSVELVKSGKLESYLLGRTPIKDFPDSDGHGRAAPGQPAHASAGVLVVSAANPLPPTELHARLLALAKEQGHDVYEVETLGGPDLSPRLLFATHPDGSRTLVRGAAFTELDTRTLRSGILAGGSDSYVSSTLGAVPYTVIAPPLLFGDIGVKRATEEQQKLPYYPPPPSK